jgi:hypothetical protein
MAAHPARVAAIPAGSATRPASVEPIAIGPITESW